MKFEGFLMQTLKKNDPINNTQVITELRAVCDVIGNLKKSEQDLLKFIILANSDFNSSKDYEIHTKGYTNISKLDFNETFSLLKNTSESLFNLSVDYEYIDENFLHHEVRFRVIQSFGYADDKSQVSLCFGFDIIPYIKKIKQFFEEKNDYDFDEVVQLLLENS